MQELGAHILEGGRFLHVSGYCDKGQAQTWLAQQYQAELETKVNIIALGDSDNDVAMLEAADIALQIRSPVHGFPKLEKQSQVYHSQHYGPEGWAESINKILFE